MMKLGDAQTDEDRAAEAAIRAVPDWAGAPIGYRRAAVPIMSPMHKAVDSDCYALDIDGTAYFLKLVHPELRDVIDVSHTFKAASHAAEAGVAPTAFHLLPEHHAMVFDYLDAAWRTAMIHDLRHADLLPRILAAKTRLHAGPTLGRRWSVFDGIRALANHPPREGAETADLWWMLDAADDIERAIEAAGYDVTPCHGEGTASNVMIGPGDVVQLVDFDQACDTDPYYDVAILLNEACVFEEEMYPALESLEGFVRPATVSRCRLYAIADDLHWGLWSSRMDATSSRRGIEFLKYANWRYLRCRMALQDPNYERWLRTL